MMYPLVAWHAGPFPHLLRWLSHSGFSNIIQWSADILSGIFPARNLQKPLYTFALKKLSTWIFETMIQPQITRDRFIIGLYPFPQMHVVHVFPFFLPGDPTCFYMFFPTCQVRVSRFNKGASLLLIPPLCPPLSFSSSLAALAAFAEWMPDRMPERTSQ